MPRLCVLAMLRPPSRSSISASPAKKASAGAPASTREGEGDAREVARVERVELLRRRRRQAREERAAGATAAGAGQGGEAPCEKGDVLQLELGEALHRLERGGVEERGLLHSCRRERRREHHQVL